MNAIAKLFQIIERIIDTAPGAMETLKSLKDEALSLIKKEPTLATPEVEKSLETVVAKAAVATPAPGDSPSTTPPPDGK